MCNDNNDILKMDDFGRNQLLKYGWSEGKGLGKNENGMIEAIRPKLKFDTTGIGHKESNDYEWWKIVFDKAASNVDIASDSRDISFKTNNKNVEIRTSKLSTNISKDKLVYGNFINTCKLEEGKIIKNKVSETIISQTSSLKLNENLLIPDDEELFKACGGRTAHKGARHGIKQSGKLARIEKQEQELIEKIDSLEILDNSWIKVKKKKKKKNREKEFNEDEVDNTTITNIPSRLSDSPEVFTNELTSPIRTLSKKTKKKLKRRLENLTNDLDRVLDLIEVSPGSEKGEKRKRKSKNKDSDSDVDMMDKKQKKKRSFSDSDINSCNKTNHSLVEVDNSMFDDSKPVVKSKNKKSKKKDILSSTVLNKKIEKKKKQKAKKKDGQKINFLAKSLNELALENNVEVVEKDDVMKKTNKKKTK
ncbi:G patch domain-containing protein 4 [Chelonus insularis]|uniref:G patch domain-containing protein 4 n=1 Tax=Chelonus insularis TaxID=460826 RepID=UPI00158870BA|nr:G patch domain-containing protein 4 [Chelonus insularis]